jgi:hypothetical protein
MGLARPLAVAGALVLSIAPCASAADHRVPLGNTDFSIPAEDCGFPIDVGVVADMEYVVKARDNADGSTTLRVTGKLRLSFTNTDTDKTVVRNVSGPGSVTLTEDGAVFESQGLTSSYLSPEEQAATGLPGLVFIVGHSITTVDADFNETGFALAGHWVDGCALLSG